MKSHISGEREDSLSDSSGSRPVSAGQLPTYSNEASQNDETSVPGKPGRLGENHGGVERPMVSVSCRTSEEIPQELSCTSGGAEDKYGRTITKNVCGFMRTESFCSPLIHGRTENPSKKEET